MENSERDGNTRLPYLPPEKSVCSSRSKLELDVEQQTVSKSEKEYNKQDDNIQLTYSFPNLEPVWCSISNSNCCFLTCIQIFQEAGQVVWYSHLFQNFPQFIVIHTVKGFGVVNEAEVEVFLELSCFFDDLTDIGNLTSGSSAFSKSSLNIWKFTVHVLFKSVLENFEHYFAFM